MNNESHPRTIGFLNMGIIIKIEEGKRVWKNKFLYH